jgi:hypothetical protein
MKKYFIPVLLLVIAVMALSVYTATYDTGVVKVAADEPAAAQSIASSSADKYAADRQKNPTGLNAEHQYDILAKNKLYGQNDYGDYVGAKVRYVDGFATVDGQKTFSKYYENKKYVKPAEEDKDREDWNLHDYHANGEMFETVGNGTMSFYTEEDRDAYIKALQDEFGVENVNIENYNADGSAVDDIMNMIDKSGVNPMDMLDAAEGE